MIWIARCDYRRGQGAWTSCLHHRVRYRHPGPRGDLSQQASSTDVCWTNASQEDARRSPCGDRLASTRPYRNCGHIPSDAGMRSTRTTKASPRIKRGSTACPISQVDRQTRLLDGLRQEVIDARGFDYQWVNLRHAVEPGDVRYSRREPEHQWGGVRVFIRESRHFEFSRPELNNNPLTSILRTVNDLLDEIVSSVFPVTGN